MENKINFIKRTLDVLPIPAIGKRKYYWDIQVPNLVIDVKSSGTKTFYVRRKINGVRHIVLIGEYPTLSVEQARARALEIGSQIALGKDPNESKRKKLAELTFGELCTQYLERHAKERCTAAKEIEAVFRRYLSDWKHRKISSITKLEVQIRVSEIANKNGKAPANNTITYAKAAINWGIRNGLTECVNPWCSVSKYHTQARERFLRPEEFGRFLESLKQVANEKGFRDYIYLSLMTGARRSNILAMRWGQVDLDLQLWTIPRTKNGESQTVPLTPPAVKILKNRSQKKSSEWVFPNDDGKTGHLVEPKRQWKALLKRAQIENLRLHDLRRTLGSYMAMGNQSLHIIGKALGHKSIDATQIYSRLTNDPIRAAMQKAQQDMWTVAGLDFEELEGALDATVVAPEVEPLSGAANFTTESELSPTPQINNVVPFRRRKTAD